MKEFIFIENACWSLNLQKNELLGWYVTKVFKKIWVISFDLANIARTFFFQNNSQWLLVTITFDLGTFWNISFYAHFWNFQVTIFNCFNRGISNLCKIHVVIYPIFTIPNMKLLELATISNFIERLLQQLQQKMSIFYIFSIF